jgi:tetratricopeptide (TPR) repeat protein
LNAEKSLEELKKSFENYGGEDNPAYLYGATWIYLLMNEWDKGYDCLSRAAAHYRKNEQTQYDLGTVCEMMRKYEVAEQCYLRAIELRPDWRSPYVRLQNMYIEWQGDTQKAREIIAMSWDKVDTTMWEDQLIAIDIQDGDLQSARERVASDDYFIIAWLYRLEGKPDSSKIYVDSLLKQLWPRFENRQDNPDWNSYIGVLYAHKGDRDSAIKYARKATEIYPLDPYVTRGFRPLISLIDVHCTFKEYDSALVIIEKLINLNGNFDLGTYLIDPDYRQLIKEPGFADIVRKYGNRYHKRLYQEKVGSL